MTLGSSGSCPRILIDLESQFPAGYENRLTSTSIGGSGHWKGNEAGMGSGVLPALMLRAA